MAISTDNAVYVNALRHARQQTKLPTSHAALTKLCSLSSSSSSPSSSGSDLGHMIVSGNAEGGLALWRVTNASIGHQAGITHKHHS
jgi:hypothetical protein